MKKLSTQSQTPLSARQTAATLIESLPWLKLFNDQIVVVKFGGNAMISHELQAAFAEDIAYLRYVGVRPVVVHGGGPQINSMLKRLGIHSEFKHGYRVTSPETMQVVRMVLTGQVNPELVALINHHGPLAMGVSGEDAAIFGARRKTVEADGQTIDLGHVGEIVEVNADVVFEQLDAGRVPVLSSIAPDVDNPGEVLNVNADAAAAALAGALQARKMVLLTDVPGLYADWPNTDSLISQLTVEELHEILPSLQSGMVPKMKACLDAVEGGAGAAAVIDGRVPHSVLVELFTDRGIGTEVIKNHAE